MRALVVLSSCFFIYRRIRRSNVSVPSLVVQKQAFFAILCLFGLFRYDKTFVFDKIAHEINQFCSVHTLHEVYISKFSSLDEALASALQETCNTFDTGLTVVSIRVTKCVFFI
jgi:hypothetical protein